MVNMNLTSTRYLNIQNKNTLLVLHTRNRLGTAFEKLYPDILVWEADTAHLFLL